MAATYVKDGVQTHARDHQDYEHRRGTHFIRPREQNVQVIGRGSTP